MDNYLPQISEIFAEELRSTQVITQVSDRQFIPNVARVVTCKCM